MSTDATQPENTSSSPRSPASGLVGFILDQRQTFLIVLLAIGLAGGVGTGYCSLRALGKLQSDSSTKKDPLSDPFKKGEDDPKKSADKSLAVPHQAEYTLGGICCAMVALLGLGLAAYVWLNPPNQSLTTQLSDARLVVLMTGGLFGLAIMTVGLAFFILWFKSASEWIDEKKTSEMKFVMLPVLTFLFGAGLAFMATGPARAEERENPLIRRLIYGSNFVISLFLLGLLLTILNAFIAVRLPSKLDTTVSGVNTVVISESSRSYLLNLSKKVLVYTLLPDSNDPLEIQLISDTKKLLTACSEINPEQFRVEELSFVLNQSKIQSLMNQFNQIPKTGSPIGLLVTIENDEKRARFIGFEDLFKREQSNLRRGSNTPLSFVGEGKLISELISLGESGQKPVIYFTQGARELALTASPDPKTVASPDRQATELKKRLEAAMLTVKELREDLNATTPLKVPDDAAVVVVADPLAPLSAKMQEALRTYMTGEGTKKGRLLVLAGAHTLGESQAVLSIGLEPLLLEYGISLRPEVVYANPTQQSPAVAMRGGFNARLAQERNPIVQSLGKRVFRFENVRAIDLLDNPPPNGSRAQPLLLTVEPRITWREPEILRNPDKEFEEMRKNATAEMIRRKQVLDADQYQFLSVIATDETGGRVVLFSSSSLFNDLAIRPGAESTNADLLAASCNWLVKRDEAANVVTKSYGMWIPPSNVETSRVFFLPVGIVLLGILAVGAGVWVFRRK